MALTKVSGGILDPGIDVAGIVTATGFDGPFTGGSSKNINAGIITATKFVGPSDSVTIGGGTTITSDGVNVTGIATATGLDVNGNGDISGNLVVGGNLTANGDFTTLNTTLREVEILRVDANSSEPAGIITQTGAGDLLRLYDGTSQVVTVDDEGNVGIGTDTAFTSGAHSGIHQLTVTDQSHPSMTLGKSNSDQLYIRRELADGKYTFQTNQGGSNNGVIALQPYGGNVGIASVTPTSTLDIIGDFKITGVSTFSGDVKLTVANGNGILLDKSTSQFNVNSGTIVRFQNGNEVNTDDGKIGTALFASGLNIVGSQTGSGLGRQIRLFGDLLTNSIKPTADSTHSIGISTNRFANAYFDNLDVTNIDSVGIITATTGDFVDIDVDGTAELDDVNVSGSLDVSVNVRRATQTNTRVNFGDNIVSLQTGATPKLILNGDNVGISSTIPTSKLDVNGDVKISGISTFAGHLLPETAGVVNIGKSDAGIGSVYLTDSGKIHLGSDQDLVINCDGSDTFFDNSVGHTYFRNSSGTSGGLLFRSDGETHISNYVANEYRIKTFNQGGVELFYAAGTYSTPKIKTTATGVTVDGEVVTSQDYPNFRPTLDFNFAAERKLDPRITYSRTGSASFVNEFGKIVLVGNNVPRFDYGHEYVNANSYKLTNSESKGLLIEEERTNLVSYSIYDGDKSGTAQTNTGDTGNWNLTLGHATFTGGIDAPDGSNDAVRFTALNTGDAIFRIPIPSFTPNGSDTYTLSFYARAISGTGNITLDLADGAPMLGSWSNNMITNEWVRIVHSGIPSNAAKTFIDIMSNSNNNRVFDVWGVQLEKGLFATSFIPTHGSVVTRSADSVKIDGEEFSEFYHDTENTTIMVGKRLGNQGGADGRLYSISDGTNNNRMDWDLNDGTNIRFSTSSGGSTVTNQEISSWSGIDDEFKIAAGMALNNQIGVVNGTAIAAADTSCAMPIGVDRLFFGLRGNGSNQGSLTIKRFMFYRKRLPDSQLVTLTS